MSLTWIIVLIVVVGAGYVLVAYNGLIRKRNQVKESGSDIDVQLKRRYDLIPNLIATVKGYATHEREAFEAVTTARATALQAQSTSEKAEAQNNLSATLKTLFAVAEAYPDLKANTNFMELQRELSDTENKIQAAHRFYNSTVLEYNTTIESVPTSIIASLFSFKPAEFFELTDNAVRSVPKVDFRA